MVHLNDMNCLISSFCDPARYFGIRAVFFVEIEMWDIPIGRSAIVFSTYLRINADTNIPFCGRIYDFCEYLNHLDKNSG